MAEKKAKKSVGGEDARQANLDNALAQITKTFGEGSIMRLGDANAQSSIEGISTGSLAGSGPRHRRCAQGADY